jgi:hypothetical protein
MQPISELRKQRRAIFLSRGATGQEVSFSFVSFLLDKQKKRKDEWRGRAEIVTRRNICNSQPGYLTKL